MKKTYTPCAYYNGKIIYKTDNGYRVKNSYVIYPTITAAKKAVGGRRVYEF